MTSGTISCLIWEHCGSALSMNSLIRCGSAEPLLFRTITSQVWHTKCKHNSAFYRTELDYSMIWNTNQSVWVKVPGLHGKKTLKCLHPRCDLKEVLVKQLASHLFVSTVTLMTKQGKGFQIHYFRHVIHLWQDSPVNNSRTYFKIWIIVANEGSMTNMVNN